ncbi:bile acid:sodium symporter family protein [Aliikangiella coralliicola]|uniref:Bile acid:sodium symporter family protein n=1 Tax=Aliikangiella coralliicola TaxID=2592383 RepID=A0A545UEQ3_9GAMM|nr:bile acid:sodium symporter family protein [Aliikangiella coralliicola]TQV87952.1 bile acid:sodium symporter family protein [Aliikangiella coralliicola]
METTFLSQVVLPFSLFIIMWGMGLSLKVKDFTRVLTRPKAVVIGIICQMALLPMIGYFIVMMFGFSAELAVGLMILTFCPGGVTSNMFSYLANGDTALSISLTAVVSILTPFTIPLLSVLMIGWFMDESQEFSIPILRTIIQLLVITVVPVAIGMLLHVKYPKFCAKAERPVKIFSVVFLFVIIAGILAKEWQNVASYFVQTGVATLVLNVLTLTLGYFIANLTGLSQRQAISIGIEVGIQNGTLALLVTGTILQSALMTIPSITYSLIMFATGALFGKLVNQKRVAPQTYQ